MTRSRFVLRQILSDRPIDDKLANIHARLGQLRIELEENKVPLSLLSITKQLTKHPEEYPDKKALPHVQVAIRMNATMTKKFKQGDTIAYVICEVVFTYLCPTSISEFECHCISTFTHLGWNRKCSYSASLSR